MALARSTLFGSVLVHGSAITLALWASGGSEARVRLQPPQVAVTWPTAAAAAPAVPMPRCEVVREAEPTMTEVVVAEVVDAARDTIGDTMTAAPQPTEGPAQTAAAAPRRATLAAAPAAAELLAPLRTRAVTAAAPPPVLAAPAPAAAPATTPAARLVVPIPGTDRAPDYPLAARRRGQAGTVVVLVHCDRDGAVQQLQVLRSSGHALLDAAALAAVRHWRFANGPGQCEQPVTFVLRS